jgi:hypothetical protein
MFSQPYIWPQDWPKHVDHYALKLHPYNQMAFVGHLIHFMHLINARNKQHINLLWTKCNLLHISNQAVPRCHYFPLRL